MSDIELLADKLELIEEKLELMAKNELLRARVLQLEQHGTSMGEIDRGGYSGSGIDYIEENKRLRAENERLRARVKSLEVVDYEACKLITNVSWWVSNGKSETASTELAKWGDIRSASLKEPAP